MHFLAAIAFDALVAWLNLRRSAPKAPPSVDISFTAEGASFAVEGSFSSSGNLISEREVPIEEYVGEQFLGVP